MLDASKAFDRVNHLSLFNKLNLRNMCPTILKFLMCTYQRQSVMVNWNGECSSTFSVGNGVKQGGVLSPVRSPKCAAITGVGVDMSPHCCIKGPNGSASYTASGSKV